MAGNQIWQKNLKSVYLPGQAKSINYGNIGVLGIAEYETIQWRKSHHKPYELESTD